MSKENNCINPKLHSNSKAKVPSHGTSLSKNITVIGYDYDEAIRQQAKTSDKKAFLAAFAALLGVINFGFVLEYVAPAIPQLMEDHMGPLRLDGNSSALFGVSMLSII